MFDKQQPVNDARQYARERKTLTDKLVEEVKKIERQRVLFSLRRVRRLIEDETGDNLSLDQVILLADICRELGINNGEAMTVIGNSPFLNEVLPYPVINTRENTAPPARTHVHARAIV